jgi:hypothetical protein
MRGFPVPAKLQPKKDQDAVLIRVVEEETPWDSNAI